MKADESRSPLQAKKHKLEHAVPTVIHHPEEELPLLARWVHHAMENPTRFWGLIAGVAVVTLGLSLLGSGLTIGRATSDEAWAKLETAKTPGERVEIAKDFPNTPAERWAKLQAASEYYNQGFNDLPSNRDSALASLGKALGLFQEVAEKSPADSPQARSAALGVARTLEARNDLDKAVAQYEKVAQHPAWAGTDEAQEADRLARALKSPEAVAFYKDLYAYKPVETTLAPGGVGSLPLDLPTGHPALNGPTVPTTTRPFTVPMFGLPGATSKGASAEPNPLDVPPPPPSPVGKAAAPGANLPLDLFTPAPPKVEAPKVEAPKVEAPRPEPGKSEPAKPSDPAPGLPPDVFSPK